MKSYMKYITALLLFGTNGIIASHITLSSYEIVFFRTMLGSLFLVILYLASNRRFTIFENRSDLICILISGIAMGASWMFLYEAYVQIGVSLASLLYYTGPVIVMVLSPLFFNEYLTAGKTIGFLLVLCGIICVNGNLLDTGVNRLGIICGLLSAVTYSVMVIANKKAVRIKGLENSMIQLTASFITVAAFTGFKSGFAFSINSSDWIWILILGIVNTGTGCYLYFSSIRSLSVQTVAICGYLEPLSVVFFAALFLQETMTTLQVIGAVLIIGGALLGETAIWKRVKKRTKSICDETKTG